jgi:hypothetical protein
MDKQPTKFCQRNDYMWQSLSIYLIILICVAILIASVSEWTITIVLTNPLIILFAMIILISFVGALFRTYMDRQLIFGNDFFTIKNRVGERKIDFATIQNIVIRKRTVPNKKNEYNLIMIYVQNRKMPIKIRANSYYKPNVIFQHFEKIKNEYSK